MRYSVFVCRSCTRKCSMSGYILHPSSPPPPPLSLPSPQVVSSDNVGQRYRSTFEWRSSSLFSFKFFSVWQACEGKNRVTIERLSNIKFEYLPAVGYVIYFCQYFPSLFCAPLTFYFLLLLLLGIEHTKWNSIRLTHIVVTVA